MDTGINNYIFISSVIFGFGLLILLKANEAIRVIIGLSLMFSASIINIAAFSGFWKFNPEGQILLYMVSLICILNISAGAGLFIRHYKLHKTNNFEEIISGE